jgi:hypothetical protein
MREVGAGDRRVRGETMSGRATVGVELIFCSATDLRRPFLEKLEAAAKPASTASPSPSPTTRRAVGRDEWPRLLAAIRGSGPASSTS